MSQVLDLISLSGTGAGDLNIENTNIKTASGVSLDEQQQTLVGSVLDVSTDYRMLYNC